MNDQIRPNHYRIGKLEAIEVIEDQGFGFNLGNAYKYMSRCGLKVPLDIKNKPYWEAEADAAIEDLRKAKTYIEFQIAYIEKLKSQRRELNEGEIFPPAHRSCVR